MSLLAALAPTALTLGAGLLNKGGGQVQGPYTNAETNELGQAGSDASALSGYGTSNLAAAYAQLPGEQQAYNAEESYLSQPYGTNTQDESQLNRLLPNQTANAESADAALESKAGEEGLAGPAGSGASGSYLPSAYAGIQAQDVGAVDAAQNQVAQQSIAQHQQNVMQAAQLAAQQSGLLNSLGTAPLEAGGSLSNQTAGEYGNLDQQIIGASQTAQEGAAQGDENLGSGLLNGLSSILYPNPGVSSPDASVATGPEGTSGGLGVGYNNGSNLLNNPSNIAAALTSGSQGGGSAGTVGAPTPGIPFNPNAANGQYFG